MAEQMFEPGDHLDGYTIIKFLGSGAFSEVYLAKNEKWGEKAYKLLSPEEIKSLLNGEKEAYLVALKVFKPHIEWIDYDVIIHEALTTAAFHENPFIVKVFDAGREGDYYYIAMEYIPGDILRIGKFDDGVWVVDKDYPEDKKKRKRKIDQEMAASIISQVCYALRPLHKRGFLHRDIKPGNILFVSDNRIKLGDFGCAIFIKDKQAENPAGTPALSPPEFVTSGPCCPESDIYSLGILFYLLLLGDFPYPPPWDFESLKEMIEEGEIVVRWPESPIQEISPILKEVVLKSTKFNPDDRYHSIDELLNTIEFYLGKKTDTFLGEQLKGEIDIGPPDIINLNNLWEGIKLDKERMIKELDEEIIKGQRERVLLENFSEAFEKEMDVLFQGLKDEMKIILYNSFRKSQSFKNCYLGIEHIFITFTLKTSGLFYQFILKANKPPQELRRMMEEQISGFSNIIAFKNLLSPRLKEVLKRAKENYPNGIGEREFLSEALKEENFIILFLEEKGIDLKKLEREVKTNEV